MNLQGKIVRLRGLEREDMPFLQQMINDEDISYMTIGDWFPVSLEAQEKWFANWDAQKEVRYIIESNKGNKIGTIMLTDIDWKSRTAGIGIKSVSDIKVRERNDIYEAKMLLLNYAFQTLNLHLIYGHILEYNKLSRKLAVKCGMVEEAVLRERVYKRGTYNNIIVCSITKQEYLKNLENGNEV